MIHDGLSSHTQFSPMAGGESEAGGVKPVRKVLGTGSAVCGGACPVLLRRGTCVKKKGVCPSAKW